MSAPIPLRLAEELHRHTLQKPAWTQMLQPEKVPHEEELPGEPLMVHPVWVQLARSLKFESCWRRRIRRKQHINIHEMAALLEAEKRGAARIPSSGRQRQPGCLGGAAKGAQHKPRFESEVASESLSRGGVGCVRKCDLLPHTGQPSR